MHLLKTEKAISHESIRCSFYDIIPKLGKVNPHLIKVGSNLILNQVSSVCQTIKSRKMLAPM